MSGDGDGVRGSAPRRRRSRPETDAEWIAYLWGQKLIDDDPAEVSASFVTKNEPHIRWGKDEARAWEHLGPIMFWHWAHKGLNTQAERELEI